MAGTDSSVVVITGIGVLTPLGRDLDSLLAGLVECRSCLRPLEGLDSGFAVPPVVAQVQGPVEVEERRGFRLSRTDRFAVAAARDAARAAGLAPGDLAAAGVIVATTVGGLPEIDPQIAVDPRKYYRAGNFARVTTYPNSHPADAVGLYLGLRGPRMGLSVACASGAMAIAIAARMVLEGRAPLMLAGGSEALCTFTLSGFNSLQALDPAPCRPFDVDRQGLNLGEGAAVVVLERLDRARARGAKVWAVLRGWAMTNDAFHPTAPHEEGRGLAESITGAMRMAGIGADDVGYVNAHGTGTPLNDVAEARAYRTAFQGRRSPAPVSSTKSYFGHTLGAAGAIEAVVTILGLRNSVLFPTLRLAHPVEQPEVEWLMGARRRAPLPLAMSVSAGFGGSNASLVLERGDE